VGQDHAAPGVGRDLGQLRGSQADKRSDEPVTPGGAGRGTKRSSMEALADELQALDDPRSPVGPGVAAVADPELVELSFRHQAVVPRRRSWSSSFLENAAGENNGVHREFLDPEMGVEKIDYKKYG
jgi:hypothetical protein